MQMFTLGFIVIVGFFPTQLYGKKNSCLDFPECVNVHSYCYAEDLTMKCDIKLASERAVCVMTAIPAQMMFDSICFQ